MEFDEDLLKLNAVQKQSNQGEATSFDIEIKRLKKEIELRDNQIETLKKANEGKKDSAILQQKIAELTNYNEDLKKFQLDKDFQINELNKILENKEKEIANLKERNRNENQADAELKAENEKLQKEIHKLNGRLNDLEIKMYKANDDRSILEKLNKELAEKIKTFEADLDEKLQVKEDELIELRDKITDMEAVIEEKEEAIKNLEEQLIEKEDLIGKLKEENKNLNEIKAKEEDDEERLRDIEKPETQEKKNEQVEDRAPKINIEDYILKSIHEEMLEEKHNEINTLINTVNVVRRDKEDLEVKIANMKSTVQEITQRLDIEMEKHSNNNEDKTEIIQREAKLSESLHAAEDKISKMKIIIKTLSKEKNDMEELILKQENKVSDLAAKIKIVEKNVKEKNKEIAENEENTMKLIKILEEQKKQIENLSKNQANQPSNKIVLSTRDEMQLKKIITEKENEITTLKVYNDNLKNDIHVKDQNIAAMQKTLSKYQEELKRLKLAKIEQVKDKQSHDVVKEKENDSKNAVKSAKLWNKKIKIEAREITKEDPNTMEILIKNKFNNKKTLMEKNIENYNSDMKLPDINKNQKNLGMNKKNSNPNNNVDNRDESDNLKVYYREKKNESKATNYGNNLRKQYSYKKENEEEIKNVDLINYNDANELNNVIEKKIKDSENMNKKEEENKDVDLETSYNMENLEAENDNNINNISNMMKKILSDEHQLI